MLVFKFRNEVLPVGELHRSYPHGSKCLGFLALWVASKLYVGMPYFALLGLLQMMPDWIDLNAFYDWTKWVRRSTLNVNRVIFP